MIIYAVIEILYGYTYSMSLFSTLRILWLGYIKYHQSQRYTYYDIRIFNVIVPNFMNIMMWHIQCHVRNIRNIMTWTYLMSLFSTLWLSYHDFNIFNTIVLNFTNITTWAYSMILFSMLRILWLGHIQCYILNVVNITTWAYLMLLFSTSWIL